MLEKANDCREETKRSFHAEQGDHPSINHYMKLVAYLTSFSTSLHSGFIHHKGCNRKVMKSTFHVMFYGY